MKSLNKSIFAALIIPLLVSCDDSSKIAVDEPISNTGSLEISLEFNTEITGAQLDTNTRASFKSSTNNNNQDFWTFDFSDATVEDLWVTSQSLIESDENLFNNGNSKYYKYFCDKKNGSLVATQTDNNGNLREGVASNIDDYFHKGEKTFNDVLYIGYPAADENGYINLTGQNNHPDSPDLNKYAMIGKIEYANGAFKGTTSMTPQSVIVRFENTRSTPVIIYLKDEKGDYYITGLRYPTELTDNELIFDTVRTTDKTNASICTVPANGKCYAIIPHCKLIIAEEGDYSIRELNTALGTGYWWNVKIEDCMLRGTTKGHTWIEFPNKTQETSLHRRWATRDIDGNKNFNSLTANASIESWDGYIIPTQKDWKNLMAQTKEYYTKPVKALYIYNGATYSKQEISLILSRFGFVKVAESNSTTYNDEYSYYWTSTCYDASHRTYIRITYGTSVTAEYIEVANSNTEYFEGTTTCKTEEACLPIKMVLDYTN